MENKINIAELLRDCPRGMELDCTMFEDIEFDSIVDDKYCPIRCRIKHSDGGYNIYNFTKYGYWNDVYKAKCVIFPKGKTTWEGFVLPCKFKDGDILVVADTIYIYNGVEELSPYPRHYVYVIADKNGFFAKRTSTKSYGARFASEEEKQKLFDAIKENGYKWNPETKTLEKLIEPKFKVGDRVKHISAYTSGIVIKVDDKGYYIDCPKDGGVRYVSFTLEKDYELAPNKFDITTLIPFESKVLVRNDINQLWIPAFWGYKRDNGYITTFGWRQYCIPYKGNEHLFNTANDCNDFYKTWE